MPVFYLAFKKGSIEIINLNYFKLNLNDPIKKYQNSNFYGFESISFYLAVWKENIEIIDLNIPFKFNNKTPQNNYYD